MFFKTLKPLFFLFFCLFLLCSCEKKEILIGFSGQLTGINSDLGIQGRNGAILALEEINSSGGVAGKKIKLIIKDDEGTQKRAKEADMELINENVIAIIGHMTSEQTMAALPVIEKANIILLSPTTSTPLLSEKKDLFFRVQGDSELSAYALGKFAAKNFDLKNLLLIKQEGNKNFTQPYRENFLKAFDKNNIFIKEIILPGKIEEIRKKIPETFSDKDYDGIIIIASSRTSASITQILTYMEKKPFIFISSWGATESLIRQGGKSVEGVFLAKTGFTDKSKENYIKFFEAYINRFGYKPSFAAEQGYNAAKIISKALLQTKGKKQGLEKALVNIKNFSSLQGNISITEFGDAIFPVSILKVKNSEFEKIMEFEPKKERRQ